MVELNGIEPSVPAAARTASLFRVQGAPPPKPPTEVDGPIVHASTAESFGGS
jgi:hypothetical protein